MRFFILSSLSNIWRDRRGNALMLMAFALPFVVGAAGLGVHTIQLVLTKRELQREADSAAMAGAYSLYQSQGNTVATAAATQALSSPLVPSATSTITPTGSYTLGSTTYAWTMYVQRQATISTPFMNLFGKSSVTVQADARAALAADGDLCAIALKNAAVVGINVQGNANINLGCGAGSNGLGANSKASISQTGNSGTLIADPLVAQGTIDDAFSGSTQLENHSVIADPFASSSLNPDTNSINNGACKSGSQLRTFSVASGNTASASPACYQKMDIQGTANLSAGTYYIVGTGNGNNTGLQIGAAGRVNCTGCTFVLTQLGAQSSDTTLTDAGTMSISGTAVLNITAPETGQYKDIFLYRDRRAPASANGCCTIVGNTGGTLYGAVYAPNDQVTFTGNGTFTTTCLQLLGATLSFDGSATINNTFDNATCNRPGNTSAWDLNGVRLIS